MRGSARLKRLNEKMDEEMGPEGRGIFYGLPDGALVEWNEETGKWVSISPEGVHIRDVETVVFGSEFDDLKEEHE